MNTNAMEAFKVAFSQTSGVSLESYSTSFRFVAAILICIAAILAVSGFMSQSNKESESFMADSVVFWIKIVVSICLSLVFLTY